jgi:hypothetical protein
MGLDDIPVGELLAGAQGEVVEPEIVEIIERGSDDLAFGQQPGMGEPEQPGQQLPPGQVARGPEQDDHVGVHARRVVHRTVVDHQVDGHRCHRSRLRPSAGLPVARARSGERWHGS